MNNLVASYRLELTTVNALNLLIHNYRRQDIEYLRKNPSFDYAWQMYWHGDHETLTIDKFWPVWAEKFDYPTQAYLLHYAMQRYGEEAYRNIDGAADWKKRLDQLLNEQHPDDSDAND